MIYSLNGHAFALAKPAHPLYSYWDGGFSDPEIQALDKTFAEQTTHKGNIGVAGQGIVDIKIRNSDLKFNFIDENTNWFLDKMRNYICNLNNNYYRFDIRSTEAFQFTTYRGECEGHYDWHTDSGPDITHNDTRKLSVVVFMSDPSEYEGGEFQFLMGSTPTTIPQKKGLVIVFPSFQLHRVSPVTKGIRKSIVTWCRGPLFV